MVRGGRGYSRGSSYRGSSRGNRSQWHGEGYGRSSRDRYYEDSYDKGRFSERSYVREEYPKAYRMDNYSRERHSPERKRPRNEGPSRHEYGGRYESYGSERRGYSSERHVSSPYSSRREESFRKPPPRGSGRGRISSRGSRGIRRDRRGGPVRRRLADRSYIIRKRGFGRSRGDFRRTKMMRIRSGILRRRRAAILSEQDSSGEEEKKTKEKNAEGEDVEMKEDAAGEGAEAKEAKEGEDAEGKPKEKKEKEEEKKPSRPAFVKLVCPQCHIKIPTFRLYESHLQGRTHLFAMRKVAAKQRSILASMRQAQRQGQNELEKSGDGITDHTVFCPLCKLNYKQERAVHQASTGHKNMKKFLMPTCKTCKETFKSPMVYEHHLCSVRHIKRKQASESTQDAEEDNLEEFTTIDSVGEVGEDDNEDENEKKKKERKRVSVGIEQIKRIEAYYCDLCRMFLPRGTENEYPDILAGHCRKHFHMQRYIRFKENESLQKRAEKLQAKENAEKQKSAENKESDNAESGEAKEGEKMETDDVKDLDNTMKSVDDDKLWDAVDKDLGELLEETDGREDDDDEERVNGERYDRFKSAQKENEEGDEAENAEEGNKDGEQ